MGLTRPTSVKETDFRLFHIGEEAQGEVSDVARRWLTPGMVDRQIEEFVALTDLEFATALFSNSTVVGVLKCDVTTFEESDTEWLVFANSTNVRIADVTCSRVLSSRNGKYFYLPVKRFIQLKEHLDLLPKLSLTDTERFFLFFGGLRISPPHLGSTYFSLSPSPCPREMLAEKQAGKRWKGASIFYQIDYGDYLILNEQGEVGLILLDPHHLPIQHYASDFDSFLRRWLSELPKTEI